MLKNLLRSIAGRRVVRAVLMGVGGGVLTAIGWKLGSDLYDLVRRRMREGGAAPDAPPGAAKLDGD